PEHPHNLISRVRHNLVRLEVGRHVDLFSRVFFRPFALAAESEELPQDLQFLTPCTERDLSLSLVIVQQVNRDGWQLSNVPDLAEFRKVFENPLVLPFRRNAEPVIVAVKGFHSFRQQFRLYAFRLRPGGNLDDEPIELSARSRQIPPDGLPDPLSIDCAFGPDRASAVEVTG